MATLAIKPINLGMFLVGKADDSSEFVASEEEAFAAIERLRQARSNR